MPFSAARKTYRRNRRRRQFNKLKPKAKVNTNFSIASRALRIATQLRKAQSTRSWYRFVGRTDLGYNDTPMVDGIDMTSAGAMAPAGWATTGTRSAVYAGGNLGFFVETVGHMARETTNSAPGYREGNTCYLKMLYARFLFNGAATEDSKVRVLLVKHTGAQLTPADFKLTYTNATTPDIHEMIPRRSGAIKGILYDKTFYLDSANNPDIRKTQRSLIIKRKLFTKYIYGNPSKGSVVEGGDPANAHDIKNSSHTFSFVVLLHQDAAPAELQGLNYEHSQILTYIP